METNNCPAGCMHYSGGEAKHQKDCPHYPESLSQIMDSDARTIADLKLCLYKLTQILDKKELSEKEQKFVSAAKNLLAKNVNILDALR